MNKNLLLLAAILIASQQATSPAPAKANGSQPLDPPHLGGERNTPSVSTDNELDEPTTDDEADTTTELQSGDHIVPEQLDLLLNHGRLQFASFGGTEAPEIIAEIGGSVKHLYVDDNVACHRHALASSDFELEAEPAPDSLTTEIAQHFAALVLPLDEEPCDDFDMSHNTEWASES